MEAWITHTMDSATNNLDFKAHLIQEMKLFKQHDNLQIMFNLLDR